jgi:excisionase family DNA binding protein
MNSKQNNKEIPQRLFDAEQAGKYLGRSPWSVRELVRSGRIPCVRDGKRIFLDRLDLDRWIEQSKERYVD